jgi:hypothetical protein
MFKKQDPPEISFQFFPPKLNAKGTWAVVPTALAISFILICYGLRWLGWPS